MSTSTSATHAVVPPARDMRTLQPLVQKQHVVAPQSAKPELVHRPIAFAALLILTAIISIISTFFLSTENEPLEVVLVGCVAVIVGAG